MCIEKFYKPMLSEKYKHFDRVIIDAKVFAVFFVELLL
jgi:hypothetical protein